MKKKTVLALTIAALCLCSLTACNEEEKTETPDETAYAYCTEFYNAAFGNYGSFSVTASDNAELETSFDDLTKFTLGEAFSGLKIESAVYSEDDYRITFSLTGALAEGDNGTIEGNGIVKGKSVKVSVPVASAEATSESVVYGNASEQQIELNLMNACFNKTIAPKDFVLSGAAKNMTIKSVSTDSAVDEDGNDELSQSAILTLTGATDGTDYAYIEISASATTYNKPLTVSLTTDFYGASVLNDHIDTFKLSDTVYVQAHNEFFKKDINTDNITFDGALKDYATIKEVEFVNSELVALHLSFPYTFVNAYDSNKNDSIGYIKFGADAIESGKEFSCSVLVASPDINYVLRIDEKNVSMEFTLDHEEWNLLSFYPFQVYYPDGTEVLVQNIETVNLDEYLSIKFTLPDTYEGLLYFELADAYNIVKSDGSSEDITIKTYFYI